MHRLDTAYFEVGLFGGAMSINDGTYPQAAAGFLLEPFVRIGAVDGISLAGTLDLVYVKSELEAAGGNGEIAFPIANRFWWFFRCGGSRDGYGHADAGLRALLRGNGDHGSVFLRVAAGASQTFFGPLNESQAGPGGSVGVEVRP